MKVVEADPRVGAALRVPKLTWVLRGFYGRFYQAPPLSTVSGPLRAFALDQGFDFLPLHGERNEENQLGIAIPFRGWTYYGSGFPDNGGPARLSRHTTFDLSLGKSVGEKWSFAVQALNVANRRFLLDNSLTFGGTHYFEPRQIYGEIRYRFHF